MWFFRWIRSAYHSFRSTRGHDDAGYIESRKERLVLINELTDAERQKPNQLVFIFQKNQFMERERVTLTF